MGRKDSGGKPHVKSEPHRLRAGLQVGFWEALVANFEIQIWILGSIQIFLSLLLAVFEVKGP